MFRADEIYELVLERMDCMWEEGNFVFNYLVFVSIKSTKRMINGTIIFFVFPGIVTDGTDIQEMAGREDIRLVLVGVKLEGVVLLADR